MNGIALVSYINSLSNLGMAIEAAMRGRSHRQARAGFNTALMASIGFLLMAISTERGQRFKDLAERFGGLITSTLLTLYILPLLDAWFSPMAKTIKRGNGASPTRNGSQLLL